MEECKNCGKSLERRQKSFCSRACRNKYHVTHDMLVPRRQQTCHVCGKTFFAYRSNKIYCSPECANHAGWEKRKERQPVRERPQGAVWNETRFQARRDQNGLCWLCQTSLDGRFDGHHTSYEPEVVVAVHPGCHNDIHHVTVGVDERGNMTYTGKAVDLLKKKLNKDGG